MARLARLAIIDPNFGRRSARANALNSTGRFKVVFESDGAKLQAIDLLEITWDALLIEELLPGTTPYAIARELHRSSASAVIQLGKLILTSVSLSSASRILAIESGFGAVFEVADGLGILIEACEVLVDDSMSSFASTLISAQPHLRADSVRAASDLALIESVDEIGRRVLASFAEGSSDKSISVEVSISQARVRQTIGGLCALLDVPTREALTWRLHLLGLG